MTITLNAITDLPEDCVVLDTETTGFDPDTGDRIVEIGAVRMRDGLPTGEEYHTYVNPERNVPQAAVDVHGLTETMLSNEPVFTQIVDGLVAFLGDAPLVAHNAAFDLKFLNAELKRAGQPIIAAERVYDSVAAARKVFPGAQANLDALCRRLKIPLTSREKHGALVDSQLLANVIVEMGGGRQQTLFGHANAPRTQATTTAHTVFTGPRPSSVTLDADTIAAHQAFVESELGGESLWAAYYANQATTAASEAA